MPNYTSFNTTIIIPIAKPNEDRICHEAGEVMAVHYTRIQDPANVFEDGVTGEVVFNKINEFTSPKLDGIEIYFLDEAGTRYRASLYDVQIDADKIEVETMYNFTAKHCVDTHKQRKHIGEYGI
jgi:hypothetical protein